MEVKSRRAVEKAGCSAVATIEHQRRPQFLQEVAAELEAKRRAARSAKARCTGSRGRFKGGSYPLRWRRAASRWATAGGTLSRVGLAEVALRGRRARKGRQRAALGPTAPELI